MKADEQAKNPVVATSPVTGETTVSPPTGHRPANPDAAVGEGIADFYGDAKAWAGRNTMWIGLGLAVILLIGLWMFWSGQSRQGTSRLWAGLEETNDPDALKAFAAQNTDTVAGRVARMELARSQLGPDGIGKLNSRESKERTSGIENIERARTEFLAIADTFPDDLAMRAEALKAAASAELALVAIPKADDPNSTRGSVAEAAKIYDRLAATVGEATTVGEWAKTRSTELKANEANVNSVAQTLDRMMTPPPSSDIKPPSTDLGATTPPAGAGPKAPTASIATPVLPSFPKTPGSRRTPPATRR